MIVDVNNYEKLLKEVASFYDKVGLRYEFIYPNLGNSNKALASSILKAVELPHNAKVGDSGCSIGKLLGEVAVLNKNYELLGFDISAESIKHATANLSSKFKNVTFKVTDWFTVGDISGCDFNLLLCLGNTLTHFPEETQKEAVKYFSTLLHTDGCFLVDCYTSWNEKLSNQVIFEPKGLTTQQGEEILSAFFSFYKNDIAIRNILFSYYEKTTSSSSYPYKHEHFVTYQFPFFLSEKIDVTELGFSSIEKIDIRDEIGIFEYFLLKK